MNSDRAIEQAYALAREQYAALGVDAQRAVETLRHNSHLAALLAGRRRRRLRKRLRA